MKLEFTWHFFEEYSNIKFHENVSSGSRVVPRGRTVMTEIIVAFRKFCAKRLETALGLQHRWLLFWVSRCPYNPKRTTEIEAMGMGGGGGGGGDGKTVGSNFLLLRSRSEESCKYRPQHLMYATRSYDVSTSLVLSQRTRDNKREK